MLCHVKINLDVPSFNFKHFESFSKNPISYIIYNSKGYRQITLYF